jgi:protein SCO1/2
LTRYSLVFLLGLLASCARPKPLEILGQVPDFQLTDQSGRPFDSKSLAGHIWVADFIYTTCDGPCPMMSSHMRRLQIQTAETPAVKLISFTVDPAHDTPPVLAEYARHFQADPNRWAFLTGDQPRLNDIALSGFKLNAVDGSMTHSTRFVLVDAKGRIRGYYITGEDAFLPHLMHDIRQLQQEKP